MPTGSDSSSTINPLLSTAFRLEAFFDRNSSRFIAISELEANGSCKESERN